MYYSGFADEASDDFDIQVKATKELGWNNIESRTIGSKNLSTLSEEEFEEILEKLKTSGVSINCYGSSIANWSKDPRSEEAFKESVKELTNVIPRMNKLGIKMLRGMSFAVIKDADPDSPEIRKNVFSKVKYLVNICEDAGIMYLHENCMNYGGMSSAHTLRLLERVNSPNLRLVFDTGNPVMTFNRCGAKPYRKQKSLDFYKDVKEFIHYVHIKDGIYKNENGTIFPDTKWTFPGEGDGNVKEIVADLLNSGYNGGFSIEPHMSVVYHDKNIQAEKSLKFNNYVEYGRKFMKIVNEIISGSNL